MDWRRRGRGELASLCACSCVQPAMCVLPMVRQPSVLSATTVRPSCTKPHVGLLGLSARGGPQIKCGQSATTACAHRRRLGAGLGGAGAGTFQLHPGAPTYRSGSYISVRACLGPSRPSSWGHDECHFTAASSYELQPPPPPVCTTPSARRLGATGGWAWPAALPAARRRALQGALGPLRIAASAGTIHSGLMPCKPPSCAGSTAVRRRRPPLPLLLVLLVVVLLLSTGRDSTHGESRTADAAVDSGQASLVPHLHRPPRHRMCMQGRRCRQMLVASPAGAAPMRAACCKLTPSWCRCWATWQTSSLRRS